MNLEIVCNVLGNKPHPRELITTKELLRIPTIPNKEEKMSFNVGELVSTLRLDTKEWNKSIEKVKKDIEELGRLAEKNNLTINLNIGISKE